MTTSTTLRAFDHHLSPPRDWRRTRSTTALADALLTGAVETAASLLGYLLL